jgi:hypothetical protein
MAALRPRKVVATLLKLTRRSRRLKPLSDGPGCTCESCVQAWDRHNSMRISPGRESRRLRLGLY